MWQSSVREALIPYLPPPVVQAIYQLDVYAEETFAQKEASITLLTTLLLAFIAGRILHFVVLRATSNSTGSAIVEQDTRETKLLKTSKNDYDATVLLCGPPNAGKTMLFHQLAYQISESPTNFLTLTSMKPNMDIVQRTRWMDLPGHSSAKVTDIVSSMLKSPTKPLRCILVLDATQPVAPAAQVLYQLWEWTLLDDDAKSSVSSPFPIIVACHKSDLPKAKNTKRIQIQVRREMEKLVSSSAKIQKMLPEGGLEWETLPGPLQVHFVATSSVQDDGRNALQRFCETGALPEQES